MVLLLWLMAGVVSAATTIGFSQPTADISLAAGAAFDVTVTVDDGSGTPVASGNVTLTTTDGTPITGTTTVAVSNGEAVFTGLQITQAGVYTLRATLDTDDNTADSGFTVTITPGTADSPAFVVQPSETEAGTVMNPSVEVAIQDAYGNTVVDGPAMPITLALYDTDGTLSNVSVEGLGPENTVNGVAVFDAVKVFSPGTYKFGFNVPVIYSNEFTITGHAPQVADVSLGLVTENSATLTSSLTDSGAPASTSYGFVLAAQGAAAPTALPADCNGSYDNLPCKIPGNTADANGNFDQLLTGLSSGTDYVAWAFAENTVGTAFSSSGTQFTTALPAVLTTPGVTLITLNSATLDAGITTDGDPVATSSGFVWGTAANPELGAPGVGSSDTGLSGVAVSTFQPDTTYHVRAWARAEDGAGNVLYTAYSDETVFTTLRTILNVEIVPQAAGSPVAGSDVCYTVTLSNDGNGLADGSADVTVANGGGARLEMAVAGLEAVTFSAGDCASTALKTVAMNTSTGEVAQPSASRTFFPDLPAGSVVRYSVRGRVLPEQELWVWAGGSYGSQDLLVESYLDSTTVPPASGAMGVQAYVAVLRENMAFPLEFRLTDENDVQGVCGAVGFTVSTDANSNLMLTWAGVACLEDLKTTGSASSSLMLQASSGSVSGGLESFSISNSANGAIYGVTGNGVVWNFDEDGDGRPNATDPIPNVPEVNDCAGKSSPVEIATVNASIAPDSAETVEYFDCRVQGQISSGGVTIGVGPTGTEDARRADVVYMASDSVSLAGADETFSVARGSVFRVVMKNPVTP